MKYLFACDTNVGIKKEINQDSLLMKQAAWGKERILLTVVCDGMGGLAKGEAASAAVVRGFSGWFEKKLPEILKTEHVEEEILASWDALLKEMNRRIDRYGRADGIKLGTTVTAMLFFRGKYFIAHVGDCRVYELIGRIVRLTKDQTLAAREVEQGILSPGQAESDKKQNVLLQCVGASEQIEPAYIRGKIVPGAVYLLCCDGFRHKVSGQEIYEYLKPENMTDEKRMEVHLKELAALNMRRGEQDNISAIAVKPVQGV